MKNIILITLLFTASLSFSQVLIVHDPADKRLASYKDSMDCYLHGLKEKHLAEIINREDTCAGRIAHSIVERYLKTLNQNIEPVANLWELRCAYSRTESIYGIIGKDWIPQRWKKPTTVIYKPEEVKQLAVVKKPKPVVKKQPVKEKTVKQINVYTINGHVVTQTEFTKFKSMKP